jgi:hypothetical protein
LWPSSDTILSAANAICKTENINYKAFCAVPIHTDGFHSPANDKRLKSPLLCLLWQEPTISTIDKTRSTPIMSHTISMSIKRRTTTHGRERSR